MTIEISKPELEALIQQRLQTGTFESVEDMLLQALNASPPAIPVLVVDLHGLGAELSLEAKNLADLFANSPFAGLDMDFERDKDFGREIDL